MHFCLEIAAYLLKDERLYLTYQIVGAIWTSSQPQVRLRLRELTFVSILGLRGKALVGHGYKVFFNAM